MRINEKIPGLPEWPDIERREKNEYTVKAGHLSYAGYKNAIRVAQWILMVTGVCIVVTLLYGHKPASAGAFFGSILMLWICRDIGRPYARDFFGTMVEVWFKPGAIIIDGREWQTHLVGNIQFIATNPAYSEDEAEKMKENIRKGVCERRFTYELRFRKIEMLYGGRLVPITSIDNEAEAAQIVTALQYAFALSEHSAASSLPAVGEDSLPE